MANPDHPIREAAETLGPTRRTTGGVWYGICPSCRSRLRVRVTPAGELPTCTGSCLPHEIREAAESLTSTQRPLEADLTGSGPTPRVGAGANGQGG